MTLVIMAAGMGSRYGGLKQMAPVGPCGEFIVDYSVYDAIKAGFDKVVFIIKKEHLEDFKQTIGQRIKGIDVEFAFQALEDIPDGFSVPEGRVKPWGTAHAVLCAKNCVKGPFAVINSDDFYSREAFVKLAEFLKNGKAGQFCMAGYQLKNTITENGSVSRGVCRIADNGELIDITERTQIQRNDGVIQYFENDSWYDLDEETIVSMNCWGFTEEFFLRLESDFKKFLSGIGDNPMKKECYLPIVASDCMNDKECTVTVLKTGAKWYGITYAEDRETVVNYLKSVSGTVYPANLWRKNKMAILVTGGAGYIGSHTSVELLNSGEKIVIADNFSNSKPIVLDRIKKITGKDFDFCEADLTDRAQVKSIFDKYDIEAVIHFAGYKAVGESVAEPLKYYDNNLVSTLEILRAMKEHGCKKIVFSSSATVYGIPDTVPIDESFPLRTINPYGATKLMIEDILRDVCNADSEMSAVLLRYFNPIGAHESGLIGEDPKGIPNNLMPYITKVGAGALPFLRVFGDDYPTRDGTGVRDYIHVVDLARGHLCALDYARRNQGAEAVNLGTGNGASVLELVTAYEKASGIKIEKKIVERRPGDAAECYADASKAEKLFGWRAEYDIERMCQDSYRWQSQNPQGYDI